MKILGKSKQDGIPSPDNPVQITNETVLIITDKEGNKKEMPFKYEKILKEGDRIEKINGKWCLVRRKPMNDIEILEKYIEELNKNKKEHELAYSTGFGKYWSDFGVAIENLIQRVKDLEQIEKEHKEENERLRDRVKQQEEENRIFALEGSRVRLKLYIEENYIPKSKIKEKIEKLLQEGTFKYKRMRKLENTIGMSPDEYAELNKLWVEVDTIETKISTFKELLEESDK